MRDSDSDSDSDRDSDIASAETMVHLKGARHADPPCLDEGDPCGAEHHVLLLLIGRYWMGATNTTRRRYNQQGSPELTGQPVEHVLILRVDVDNHHFQPSSLFVRSRFYLQDGPDRTACMPASAAPVGCAVVMQRSPNDNFFSWLSSVVCFHDNIRHYLRRPDSPQC